MRRLYLEETIPNAVGGGRTETWEPSVDEPEDVIAMAALGFLRRVTVDGVEGVVWSDGYVTLRTDPVQVMTPQAFAELQRIPGTIAEALAGTAEGPVRSALVGDIPTPPGTGDTASRPFPAALTAWEQPIVTDPTRIAETERKLAAVREHSEAASNGANGNARELIATEPGKLGGFAHVAGTRVTTAALAALSQRGFTEPEILALYPGVLDIEQIHAALVWEHVNPSEPDEGSSDTPVLQPCPTHTNGPDPICVDCRRWERRSEPPVVGKMPSQRYSDLRAGGKMSRHECYMKILDERLGAG